jgi:hypothetical protein
MTRYCEYELRSGTTYQQAATDLNAAGFAGFEFVVVAGGDALYDEFHPAGAIRPGSLGFPPFAVGPMIYLDDRIFACDKNGNKEARKVAPVDGRVQRLALSELAAWQAERTGDRLKIKMAGFAAALETLIKAHSDWFGALHEPTAKTLWLAEQSGRAFVDASLSVDRWDELIVTDEVADEVAVFSALLNCAGAKP